MSRMDLRAVVGSVGVTYYYFSCNAIPGWPNIGSAPFTKLKDAFVRDCRLLGEMRQISIAVCAAAMLWSAVAGAQTQPAKSMVGTAIEICLISPSRRQSLT